MSKSLNSRLDRLEGAKDEWTLYRVCPRCGQTVFNGHQNESEDPCSHDEATILRGRADIEIRRCGMLA